MVVVSQEPDPEQYDLGAARDRAARSWTVCCRSFVLDRYEGHEPRLLQELTREGGSDYVEQNAAAVRELLPADLVFANHVLLGARSARRRARPTR